MRAACMAISILATGCSAIGWLFVSEGPDAAGTIALGQRVASTTDGDEDTTDLSCGETIGAPEEAWIFTAPDRGRFTVRVEARYDAVVAVRRDGPDGDEIACNDDFGERSVSAVEVRLDADEAVAILVDGFRGAHGAYVLSVERAPALGLASDEGTPPEDEAGLEARCASAPALALGPSRGVLPPRRADATVSCGEGGRGGDVVYRLDVERPSTLQIEATSEFDAILELRRGCSRGHRVVACVDDAPDVRHTALTTHLEAGRFYLVLDSYQPGAGGPFFLDVSLIPDAADDVPFPVSR